VIVSYGVSISAVSDNLIESVKYRVEEFTGMEVEKITIFVEGVRVIDSEEVTRGYKVQLMPKWYRMPFWQEQKVFLIRTTWIHELTVFPVPDGHTGTNMTLTIMAAAKEVAST